MKPFQPASDQPVTPRAAEAVHDVARPWHSSQWHPNAQEFTRGVEVTEVLETLPGELWDLFTPAARTN
jgi:hypothetical protein